jgi:hypothetical protein
MSIELKPAQAATAALVEALANLEAKLIAAADARAVADAAKSDAEVAQGAVNDCKNAVEKILGL